MEIKIFDVEKEQESTEWEVWADSTTIWMGKDYHDDIDEAQKILAAGGVAHFYAHSYEWADREGGRKREVTSIVANPDFGMVFEETRDLLGAIKHLEEYFDFPERYADQEVQMCWFIAVGESLVLRKSTDRRQPYVVRAEDREAVEELTGIDSDADRGTAGEEAATLEINYAIEFCQ